MNARMLIVLFVAVAFGTAGAKEGGGGSSGGGSTPNPGMPQGRQVQDDVGGTTLNPSRDVPAGFQINGTVTDGSGNPLSGVVVKLFNNGVTAASAQTAADGSFKIEANPAVGGNNTSVLWFQSPDPEHILDAQAVLSEGTAAKQLKLFPPCVQRVTMMDNQATVAVRLMTPDEAKAAVKSSKCLGAASS